MSDKQLFKYIQPNTDDLDNLSIDHKLFFEGINNLSCLYCGICPS